MSISSCLADAAWLDSLGTKLLPGIDVIDWTKLLTFVVGSIGVGVGLYLLIAYWFHVRYYRDRRDEAESWKCQPQRFPTPRMQRIDLWLGIANIGGASFLSGFLAYWLATSTHSRIYISPAGHSPFEVVGGILLYYLATDVVIYWAHRLYHRPQLFRWIHRYHHRNTTPTAFTAFSMHPVEFLTYQGIALVPLIFFPLNAIGVILVLLSSHIEALIQHSGVRVNTSIPWMPSTFFHDDHHRYFHCNYGQHLTLWDRVFGSLRRHGRRYGAEVFGSEGAPLGKTAEPVRFVDYRQGAAHTIEPLGR